jgi:hypothetical protein
VEKSRATASKFSILRRFFFTVHDDNPRQIIAIKEWAIRAEYGSRVL